MLVEQLPMMICRFDQTGKCDYVNHAWSEFTGRTIVQDSGDGWADGIHRDDRTRCMGTFFEHVEQQRSFAMEFRLRRYDGQYEHVIHVGAPFRDNTGHFAGFIASCTGLDDQRRATAQTWDNGETLETSLRTPLVGMADSIHKLAYELAHGRAITYESLRQLAEYLDRISSLITNPEESSPRPRQVSSEELVAQRELPTLDAVFQPHPHSPFRVSEGAEDDPRPARDEPEH